MNRLELAAAAGVTPAAITKSKLPRVRLDDGSLHFDSKDPQVIAYINRKPKERRKAQADRKKKSKAAPPNLAKMTILAHNSRSHERSRKPTTFRVRLSNQLSP